MRFVNLGPGNIVAVDEEESQMLGGKREAGEEMADVPTEEKKPRLVAGAKVLPRRPSGELLHREPHLQALHAALARRASQRAVDVAITGTAGVGKTELVLNFVASHADEFQHVLWINAESKQTAESSVLETAKMLEMGEVDKVHMPLLLTKMYRLCSESKCLVVFDNAASPEMLQEFLPPFHLDKSSLFTVVTSQFVDWDCETQLSVACFSPEQSQLFLTSHLEQISASEASEMSTLLGNLPLALQLAVSFIKLSNIFPAFDQESTCILDFIISLKVDPKKFFNHQLAPTENIGYSKSLSQIYDNAFRQLKELQNGYHVIKIISMISFIKSDEITSNMFRYLNAGEKCCSEFDLSRCFSLLQKYSFFSSKYYNYVSVLPITQTVIRAGCTEAENRDYIESVLKVIFKEVEFEDYYLEHRLHDLNLSLHFQVVWNHAHMYPHFIKKYSIIPVAIANEMAGDEEFLECISFVEGLLTSMEAILDNSHKHFVKLHVPYLRSLNKANESLKVVTIANKVLKHIASDGSTALDILQVKASSLLKLKDCSGAFDIISKVHTIRMRDCDENQTCEPSIRSMLSSYKLMCKTACKMYEEGSNTVAISLWIKLMDEIFDKTYSNHLVQFLPSVEKYLTSIDKGEHMLLLYDRLQDSLDLSEAHLNLLNKAKLLCDLRRNEESWAICLAVGKEVSDAQGAQEMPASRGLLLDHIDRMKEELEV